MQRHAHWFVKLILQDESAMMPKNDNELQRAQHISARQNVLVKSLEAIQTDIATARQGAQAVKKLQNPCRLAMFFYVCCVRWYRDKIH